MRCSARRGSRREEAGSGRDAAHQVSQRELQEPQVSQIGDARDREKGERTRLGRHNGKKHRAPRELPATEEVVATPPLVPAEPCTPGRNPQQVGD